MKVLLSLCLAAIVCTGFDHSVAQAQDSPVKVSLSAFKERTQVAVGFQREWLTRSGEEFMSPRASWVAVVPASYNLTPSVDVIGQLGYNLTSKASRWVLGVRVVVFGGK